MSPYYERYCSDCKKFGYKPTMTKKELHEAWGIKDEADHIPLVARQSKKGTAKNTIPTLETHKREIVKSPNAPKKQNGN